MCNAQNKGGLNDEHVCSNVCATISIVPCEHEYFHGILKFCT